ncbi:MAG: hypothetical protein PHQ75_09190 [Thermoguttaceae bacterium]|nr:hypothetical protein [Thermoguttaceae bacterium]
MPKGLDLFREAFAAYPECYVLIGGVACAIVLDSMAIPFRTTKDLDIVLCLENMNVDFGRAFWDFIRQGRYTIQEMTEGKKCFYRFGKPENESYPFQLELFSRLPDSLVLTKENNLTPIPLDETVSSLSAILLDGDYYSLIQQNKRIVTGLSTVSTECLIVLKAKAFMDLLKRKLADEHSVDSRNIRKHRNDVARLFTGTTRNSSVQMSESLRTDMQNFMEQMEKEDIDLKSLNLPFSQSDLITGLRQIF